MKNNQPNATPAREKLRAYLETLSEDQLRDVLAMIRSFKADAGSAESLDRRGQP